MKFDGSGSVQSGWRPGIVFQNNIGNSKSPNVVAIPLTTSVKKSSQPTHVVIKSNESGLIKDSMAICENPETLPKSNIGSYITTLPNHYMSNVAVASTLASCAISFLDFHTLIETWNRAVSMNKVSA